MSGFLNARHPLYAVSVATLFSQRASTPDRSCVIAELNTQVLRVARHPACEGEASQTSPVADSRFYLRVPPSIVREVVPMGTPSARMVAP